MIQRQTQTAQYWDEAFNIEDSDLEHLYNLLLEDETPLATDELVLALVRRRAEREDHALQRQVYGGGTVYLPKESYTVGQEVIFPHLQFSTGHVVAVRPGHNPEFGQFGVISVDFANGRPARDFAAGFAEHKLNAANSSLSGDEAPVRTPEELAAEYGRLIHPRLEARLKAKNDIVRIAGRWFPKPLLVDINEGHLNLAEAVLDMSGGGPLPTSALVPHLDLPTNVNEKLKLFSLDFALQEDSRFDEVGPAGQMMWFLHRLEPQEVTLTPRCLRAEINHEVPPLHPELSKLELELDDEFGPRDGGSAPGGEVMVTLTFPHRRAGTLPLSARLAPLFPTAIESPRIRFVLVDGHTGQQQPGWVVRQGRYVFGLGEWYQKYEVPAGGHLTVQPGANPGEVIIKIARRRPVREWVRSAVLAGGHLTFAMQKRPIAVEYEEQMIVAVDNVNAVDDIWAATAKLPLAKVVVDTFRELAKLTPQSAVHARSLYSAVNVIRRLPPGPIFAELMSRPYFVHVGDAYWRFDESHYSE